MSRSSSTHEIFLLFAFLIDNPFELPRALIPSPAEVTTGNIEDSIILSHLSLFPPLHSCSPRSIVCPTMASTEPTFSILKPNIFLNNGSFKTLVLFNFYSSLVRNNLTYQFRLIYRVFLLAIIFDNCFTDPLRKIFAS